MIKAIYLWNFEAKNSWCKHYLFQMVSDGATYIEMLAGIVKSVQLI